MKDEVDINVLDKADNASIKRYPYFAVKVTVDEDGGYVLVPNDRKLFDKDGNSIINTVSEWANKNCKTVT